MSVLEIPYFAEINLHVLYRHLMFRDGVLSPRSKLLPHDLRASATGNAPDRSQSVLSIVSNGRHLIILSGYCVFL